MMLELARTMVSSSSSSSALVARVYGRSHDA